jgi:hypothetical protein
MKKASKTEPKKVAPGEIESTNKKIQDKKDLDTPINAHDEHYSLHGVWIAQ